MNLQEKYDLLMEKIADKSLEPWLIFEWWEILLKHDFEEWTRYDLWDTDSNTIFRTTWVPGKIIWHPITIGRALQRSNDNRDDLNKIMYYRPKSSLDKPIEPTEDFEPIIDYLLNI